MSRMILIGMLAASLTLGLGCDDTADADRVAAESRGAEPVERVEAPPRDVVRTADPAADPRQAASVAAASVPPSPAAAADVRPAEPIRVVSFANVGPTRSPLVQSGEWMTEPIMHRSAASPGRSPLTQAGELFEQPVPLDTDGEEQPEAPDGPVPWDEAHEYVGQVITAEGEIVRTNEITTRGGEGDRITFLNFADDWRGTFTVVIHERYYDDFPPNLGTFYDGKTLRVTGLVTEHRGSPQIEPESSDQVEVLAD